MTEPRISSQFPQLPSGVFPTHDGAHGSGVLDLGARRTRARVAAGALDALVRALRTQQPGMDPLIERAWEILVHEPAPRLELGATACTIDGEVALDADAERGRWLLPAFMAGLRSLTVEEDSRPADVVALGQALSTLRCVPSMLGQFADWIWSDGLEGVRAELHTSFAEILEVPDDPARHVVEIRAVRSEMADALASELRVTANDLDAAAVLAEFQAPLDTFTQHSQAGNLSLAPAEATDLRHRSEETAFWVRQEIMLALAHPELRKSMSPRSLARQLVRVAGESFDQFLALCSALAGHPDPYAKSVIVALEEEPIGETIAARAPLDRQGAIQLAQVIRGQSHKLAAGVVHGLIERAHQEGAVAEQFAGRMASVVGEQAWCGKLEPSLVSVPARPAMARIAAMAQVSPPQMAKIIAVLKPSEAIALVPHLPRNLITALEDTFLGLLAAASVRERAVLTPQLLEGKHVTTTRRLVASLVQTRGEGWDLRTVRLIAQAAIAEGMGDQMLQLQRTTSVPLGIRLGLLETLVHANQMAESTLKWRASELLDSPEIRERLSELRKTRKS